jgi:hypothetical protein
MEVMGWHIVPGRQVTLRTHAVSGRTQLQAVRFVAVAAGHSGTIHLALQERAIDIDFILHLAIGMVQTGLDEAW